MSSGDNCRVGLFIFWSTLYIVSTIFLLNANINAFSGKIENKAEWVKWCLLTLLVVVGLVTAFRWFMVYLYCRNGCKSEEDQQQNVELNVV